MTWYGDVQHVKVVLLYQAVRVNPHEELASVRAPVSYDSSFDMLGLEWFLKQRLVAQIKHTQT